MPTLRAHRLGINRINQARKEKGWSWSTSTGDDTPLVEASQVLEPEKNWLSEDRTYANGISEGTWKRFLAGKQPISADAFKAYCQVLGLNWEEVVDRRSSVQTSTHQDWGEAIDTTFFHGRNAELEQLKQWILTERCRLVALSGMGGIGKTALSAKLAEQIQNQFEYLIWRSLRHAPLFGELLADLVEFLSDGQETDLQRTVNSQVSRLIEYLKTHRCLLVLDDVETVLRSGELAGQYREGYQDYRELIRRVGEERHQSCLVLLSRENPVEISSLAGATLPVRSLRLSGLSKADAKKILQAKGFSVSDRGWEDLIQLYRGNPLALKIIANTIQEVFNGDISQFFEQSTLLIGDIFYEILSQQFARLSALEKDILYWLALENKPISIAELRVSMQLSASLSELITALESLKMRSLVERPILSGDEPIFSLQPMIMKYVVNQFIEQVRQDIVTVIETRSIERMGVLRSHVLVKKQGQRNIQEMQTSQLLKRVIDRLYKSRSERSPSIKAQLNELLSILQGQPTEAIGNAESNTRNLLSFIEKG